MNPNFRHVSILGPNGTLSQETTDTLLNSLATLERNRVAVIGIRSDDGGQTWEVGWDGSHWLGVLDGETLYSGERFREVYDLLRFHGQH